MHIEHVIDRSGWPRGPWDAEPDDRVEWRSAEGVPCLALRSGVGAWCGYAAVPPGHPWHGLDAEALGAVDVHGGLTYAARCAGPICHVPQPGESDEVWWLGFDCCHLGDRFPRGRAGGVYRDVDFVRAEVTVLARRIVEAAR